MLRTRTTETPLTLSLLPDTARLELKVPDKQGFNKPIAANAVCQITKTGTIIENNQNRTEVITY